MRVVFFGTAAFALPSLERVAASRHRVVMCVTQPDRPQGRGLAREPSPVKRAALRLGLALLQPERPSADLCDAVDADVGVVAAYGQLIRRDLLALPPHGMIGVHPSLLPRYRGAAPVAWALLQGERTTGVTIFRLNEALDAGDILVQRELAIEPREDAQTLTVRLAQLGAEELVRALDVLAEGRAVFTPQDEAQASFAPKLTKSQGRIDWHQPAEAIDRQVRALTPWPGAWTMWREAILKIWRASVVEVDRSYPPGTVVLTGDKQLCVATRDHWVRLDEIQPANKTRMSARELLAGYDVRTGEVLT